MERTELLKNIVVTLDNKKAMDIKSLEITDLTVVADYFVIATGWILLDYGTVIVHLFTADQRELYSLEHLWGDAKQTDISGYISE